MADQSINIIFKAINLAKKTFDDVNKNVKKVENETKKSFDKIKSYAKTLLGTFAGVQIANFAKESVINFAKFEQ